MEKDSDKVAKPGNTTQKLGQQLTQRTSYWENWGRFEHLHYGATPFISRYV